ncbi:MAG: tetratricopeptide repeat protein [Bacteroidetes bacterium]|nr:tetratricopeptide repeat protein [Bacteroidota bacterium]
MINIPTGIVTFLFTDIEGSLRLSQEYPDKIHFALEKHNSILQNAIDFNNGLVFQITGDAFCSAFENADDAVKAAVDIQLNIVNERWDDAEIKIRIGIHSGKAEWNGKGFMGYITLARTARVMSAAYGGQILISNDSYSLLDMPVRFEDSKISNNKIDNPETLSLGNEKEIEFRDLGERRLKDVYLPIRLYQVTFPGLREVFPPLNSLDARPNNLPVQLTSFIGREKEMKNLKDYLKLNRLVTLTSAGGSGKTRLALQTAADVIDNYENGVWFIDLAAVNDPLLLTATINEALCIKEESKITAAETLADFLKEKEILLVLDNCEQIIHACAELTERLLSLCPKLKIIATSRESLNCRGEKSYRIPPLTMPDPDLCNTPEELAKYESVRLFIERALAVNPVFRVNNENASVLAEVCSQLDGIPLAIELAAARIKILTVEKIFERLDDRFRLLTGGKRTALPRQQTLRALIDWSYDLLTEEEKIFWSRLSVFSGGWTLEAAEDVCSDEMISKNEILDLLGNLTEKSVILYDESKNRYMMLESIKQYGVEKLTDRNGMFLRHLNYFLEVSEKSEPELRSKNAKFRLTIIAADQNNFTSAIDWSVENGITDKGAIIAATLGEFWSSAGLYSTGIRLINRILQSSDTLAKPLKRKLLYWIGVFKWSQGDYEQAKKYSEESLAISKGIGDKKGIDVALKSLSSIAYYQSDYEQACKYSEESLSISKEIGDKRGIAVSMNSLGNTFYYKGDYEQAKKYYKESLAFSKEAGDNKVIAVSLNNLAYIANHLGDYELARIYSEESRIYSKEIGDKNVIAVSLTNLGITASNQGDHDLAKKYYEESLAIRKEIGDKRGIAISMNSLGNVLYSQKDYEQAKKYYKESLIIYKAIGDKNGIADCMNNLGYVLSNQEDYVVAVKLFSASEKIRESTVSAFDKKDRTKKNETIAKLIKQLSEEEFSKFMEEGRNLTIEEAVAMIIEQ